MSYTESPIGEVSKTANYTVLVSDRIIFVDTTGGAFSLTLPDPSKARGILFRIIDAGGVLNTNNLTLVRFAAEKIEGLAASKLLQTNWGGWDLVSNGTDWFLK